MKNIHELLSAIEIEVPEDKKADFEKAFAENYKTVAEVGKITTARDNYKSQLETAQNALKEFEGVDVKELNGRITQLTNDLAAKESDYQAKIADMEFSAVLDNAISASGARDAVSVKAHLDLNTLKDSKNQAEDIKAAIEAVKTDKAYLFGADEPINNAVRETNGTITGNASDALRAAMGLPAESKN